MIKTASTQDLERLARSMFSGIRAEFIADLAQAREDMARVVQMSQGTMGILQGHASVAFKRHKELSDRMDGQVHDAQRDRDAINALDTRLIQAEKQIAELHLSVNVLHQQLTDKLNGVLKAFAKLEDRS